MIGFTLRIGAFLSALSLLFFWQWYSSRLFASDFGFGDVNTTLDEIGQNIGLCYPSEAEHDVEGFCRHAHSHHKH